MGKKGLKRLHYYALSLAALAAIAFVKIALKDINLPPLNSWVRLVTAILYTNLAAAYLTAVSPKDPSARIGAVEWRLFAVVAALLCFLYPVFSGDLFESLLRGRMLAVYHESSYRMVPDDIPQDILYAYSTWKSNPDAYGPVYVYLQTLPALVCGENIGAMVWLLKTLLLGFYAAFIYVFGKICRRLTAGGGEQEFRLIALNPLLFVLTVLDGKNDIILLFFMAAAVWALLERHYFRVFFCWTLAFCVKFTAVIALPALVIWAMKDAREIGRRISFVNTARGALLCLVTTVALFAPLWGGGKNFWVLAWAAGESIYSNTIPYLALIALEGAGLPADPGIVKGVFLGGFAVASLIVWGCFFFKKGAAPRDAFRALVLSHLVFYACVTRPLQGNYLTWALPWLALCEWPKTRVLVLLYSFAGLFSSIKRMNFLLAIGAGLYALILRYGPRNQSNK